MGLGLRHLLAVAVLAALALAPHEARAKAPPAPLPGDTYDYAYDAADIGRPERAWLGRAFVHQKVAAHPERPAPLVVFIHGTNDARIPYRWMGGGDEGDVRRIVADLIDAGAMEPAIVAAPSSVEWLAIAAAQTAWPAFDLDNFVARTVERLRGVATIDLSRVIVAGHSGAGCNVKGGIATALQAKLRSYAGLVIDTCMGTDLAPLLVERVPPETQVIVTWQSLGWTKRTLKEFGRIFRKSVEAAALPPGTVRLLDEIRPRRPMPHDAMVYETLEKYLPRLLPPATTPGATASR